jgi:hypothetical protein
MLIKGCVHHHDAEAGFIPFQKKKLTIPIKLVRGTYCDVTKETNIHIQKGSDVDQTVSITSCISCIDFDNGPGGGKKKKNEHDLISN